jgi:hypothetical protein
MAQTAPKSLRIAISERFRTRFKTSRVEELYNSDMPNRRRITIAVETDRVVRLHPSAAPVRAWCPGCDADAPMASPETAALLAGVGTRAIYRGVERATLHFAETADGLVRVCLRSLGLDTGLE